MNEIKTRPLPRQDKPYEIFVMSEDKESQLIGRYLCGECHQQHFQYNLADECCKDRLCKVCKTNMGKKWGSSICSSCWEKQKEEKAETVEYAGQVLADIDGDDYFFDIGEAIDKYIDEYQENTEDAPQYLYVCKKNKWEGIDIDSVVENELEDHHEAACDYIVDRQGLYDFVKNWNEKQTLESWTVEYKQKIDFHKILAEELKEEPVS